MISKAVNDVDGGSTVGRSYVITVLLGGGGCRFVGELVGYGDPAAGSTDA